jgi:endonuclease G, mitochondrial
MPDLFSAEELKTLRDAAIGAGLADQTRRLNLFTDVMPRFTATINTMANPLEQIKADLRRLNETENLPDGTVPMLQWLQNAAESAYGRSEAKVFEAAYTKLSARILTPNRAVSTQPVNARGQEITLGRNDLLDFSFLQNGNLAGESVAKILVKQCQAGQEVKTPAGAVSTGSGTCWLLTPTLALTNHHVINARPPDQFAEASDFELQASKASVQFGYDYDGANGETFQVEKCVLSDTSLDFALLRLKTDTKRKPLRIRPTVLKVDARSTVAVNIIQHPNGMPKQVGIRNNLVNDSTEREISYFTDTMYGSSGSAVLDDHWEVVALHRGFQPVTNVSFQGKDTAFVNYGSQILQIAGLIREKNPGEWTEILAAQPQIQNL